MARWPKSTSAMPGAFHIDEATFEQLEELIRHCELSGRRVKSAMNDLTKVLAFTALAEAQKRSRGFVDPRGTATITKTVPGFSRVGYSPGQNLSSKAWQIPVRRITSAYYHGWQVRRIRHGEWMTFNDSREAYYIEYGIHVSSRRIRRPIAKLSLQATMIMANPVIHRFSDWVFQWGKYSVQSPSMTMGIHPASGTNRWGGYTAGGYIF